MTSTLSALLSTSRDELLGRQLLELQRFELLGRLAGGVAHDVDNELAVVVAYAGALNGDTTLSDEARADLQEIEAAAGRAAGLLRELRGLCRHREARDMVVGVRAIIHTMESSLRRLAGHEVRLVIDDDSAWGAVVIDPAVLEQLILNLALHARDVMPSGGQLSVSARIIEVSSGTHQSPASRPGRFVEFAVTDTGPALSAADLASVLDPTWLADDSALGLAVVARIVARANGFLEVDRTEEGTTFRACIPEASQSVRCHACEPIITSPGEDAPSRSRSPAAAA